MTYFARLDEQIVNNISSFLEWRSNIEFHIAIGAHVPLELVEKLNNRYTNTLKLVEELAAEHTYTLKRFEIYRKVYDSIKLPCSVCKDHDVYMHDREECTGCENVYCSHAFWDDTYYSGYRDCGTVCDGCGTKLCYNCLDRCNCCGCDRLFCTIGCYRTARPEGCCGPECGCNHL